MDLELEQYDFKYFDWKNPADNQVYNQILQLMESSFPVSERRTQAGQRFLFKQPDYMLLVACCDARVVAFLAWWKMRGFRFVEHLATDDALRGQGIGGKMLDLFLKADKTPCVLEVELPENDLARRRVAFYRRHGLELCPYAYMQMPLRPDFAPMPLALMSTCPLDRLQFAHVRDALYARVYTCGTDLI